MARLCYFRHKKQYNVIKKACLALFLNKAVSLKMHSVGFQSTYYHADISKHAMVKFK